MGTIAVTDPDQLEVFPSVLRLQRIDNEQNMRRFYLMTVQRDLFGGAVLVKEWGRIGSSGRLKREHYADEGQAVDALAIAAKTKTRRGYNLHGA